MPTISSNTDSVKSKRKRFKKLKGFFGKSKKASKRDIDDDSSTAAYSVRLDSTSRINDGDSIASEISKSVLGEGEPIAIILLVMDTKTRRFELLQLEFDSATAKVRDIFDQISVSATEESLKDQKYNKLCSLKGESLVLTKNISEYITGSGILIAALTTHNTETSEKIAKMALPILTNPKVHSMLLSSDLIIPDLPPPREKKETEPTPKSAPLEATPEEEEGAEAELVEEKPVEVVEEKKVEVVEEKKVEEKKVEVVEEPKTEIKEPEEEASEPVAVTKECSGGCCFSAFLSFAAMVTVIAHLVLNVHLHYTSPLGPGMKLSPGRSHGLCGIEGFSPTSTCKGSSIFMGSDGVLTVTSGDDVIFEMQGDVCDDSDCVAGLTIDQDGKMKIGGVNGKITVKPTVDLQPWPFTEDVVIGGKKKGVRKK